MSFRKAVDLLRLAEMASASYSGVSLVRIEEEFGVNRRTAQRMTRALEDTFVDCRTRTDEERRKFWKLGATDARMILSQGVRDAELTALEMSIRRAERDGATTDVSALSTLRDRLLSAMPSSHARRVETDAEALLEAYGFASRPGPRVHAEPRLLGAIAEALKGPHLLTITYRSGREDSEGERLIEPYGLLLGTRRYLVARMHGGDTTMRHFRLDRILEAKLEASSFGRDQEFDLSEYAAKAFGSFHADQEYCEVMWRFTPKAAATAREFVFHPNQEMTDEPDGSLTVQFAASGYLEMAWHLYQWGDAVEVMAPQALRELVADYQRSDFPAFP